jgi:hypothetical protein
VNGLRGTKIQRITVTIMAVQPQRNVDRRRGTVTFCFCRGEIVWTGHLHVCGRHMMSCLWSSSLVPRLSIEPSLSLMFNYLVSLRERRS